jgi:hypothetical protein
MTSWTFEVKFTRCNQLTFGSLTFATREDGNLRLLSPGPAPEHLAPTHGQDLCCPTTSSTSGNVCTGQDSYAGVYIYTSKLVWGISVMMSILQPKHRDRQHRQCPLINIYLMTIQKSGSVPLGTPPRRVA